jgi:prepilin-type processing-associated H-X9-DG protein
MYADDYHGIMPVNRSSNVPYWRSLPGSWVVGNVQMDISPTNIASGTLFPYHGAVGIYHCPTDRSTLIAQPQLQRWRSCMLSIFLNGSVPEIGRDWARIKVNTAALLRPAGIFTFIDTSEWTIVDGGFSVRWPGMAAGDQTWNDYPTDRHQQGVTLCFADGHGERWKWRYPKRARTLFTPAANALDLQDLRRLQAALPIP